MTFKTALPILLIAITSVLLISVNSAPQPANNSSSSYALVIHGGAGNIQLSSAEDEKAYHDKLTEALQAGEEILKSGGSSLDAVQSAICILEDSPLFNAGKGSVFTHDGRNEMDASMMDGRTLQAGAVSGVRHVKNPIVLARAIMDSSVHVMLSGTAAEEFAQKQKVVLVDSDYFYTPQRWKSLQKVKARTAKKEKHGTVGAVALDMHGNLAAGTSTGGMTNKRYGRIGDSPVIGAGTYADNNSCAVSCTGHGEYFIRHVVAYDVAARMKYNKQSLDEAAGTIIYKVLEPKGGSGGLIALDKEGNISMPFNTRGMFRGYVKSNGDKATQIYK